MRREDIHTIFPHMKTRKSEELRQKSLYMGNEDITRFDLYYFDHGNAE